MQQQYGNTSLSFMIGISEQQCSTLLHVPGCSSVYYAGLIIMMCIKLSHDKKVKGGSQVKRKQRNSPVPNLTTFTLCLKQNSSKTRKAICFAWCRAEPATEFEQSNKIIISLDSCSSSNAVSNSGWNTSMQAYTGRNKIISAADKYYFIRSVPKHLHFSYYGMRAEYSYISKF